MIWGKQFYHYDVARWLIGDPAQPPPPPGRQSRAQRALGSPGRLRRDVDAGPVGVPLVRRVGLAFHAVALAHLDPAFAKYQLILLCREWFQHPNGAIPAYEWAFDDLNPPVQAWAALQVFEIDGRRDLTFLTRVFPKLLLNFTWWVNRQDAEGSNLFEGGFLGLDNIGPIDRSHLPDGVLEQSDATAWMAFYCLNMLEIARELAQRTPALDDLVIKFMEHFALISNAMHTKDLWDEQDGFYYDMLRGPDGRPVPLRVRSMVGIIPLFSYQDHRGGRPRRGPAIRTASPKRCGAARPGRRPQGRHPGGQRRRAPDDRRVVARDRVRRILAHLLDEDSFLSRLRPARGVAVASRPSLHRVEMPGYTATIDYEPAESTTGMFGGNSNWRGPLWMPLNYLVLRTLDDYYANSSVTR